MAEALGVKPFNVRDWRLRNSIPAERWQAMVSLGWTSLEELAAHVALPLPANDPSDTNEDAAA